jgi:hypothetical protein
MICLYIIIINLKKDTDIYHLSYNFFVYSLPLNAFLIECFYGRFYFNSVIVVFL